MTCTIACTALCSVVQAQDVQSEDVQSEDAQSEDAQSEDAQSEDVPAPAEPSADVASWRTRARPRVDLAGSFRFRAHRWQRYHLGREDEPFDQFRRSTEGVEPIGGCGDDETCNGGPLRFADLRLRLSPSLHVTDYASVHATIDVFDGLTLGATPRDSVIPWSQEGTDAITLRHVWAQLRLPSIGELRVGRMPAHFGLGLVQHAGNGIDDDAGTDVDRIEVRTRLGPITARASWDFTSRGETAGIESAYGDVPFDASRQDDTRQWTLAIEHTDDDAPVRGGFQLISRRQSLERTGDRWTRRDLRVYTPDVWLRIEHRGFRVELEGAAHLGSVRSGEDAHLVRLRQGAVALELEQTLLERRLRIGLRGVAATGDPQLRFGQGSRVDDVGSTASHFAVHPSYRLDEILWRRVLGQVAGAWVLRPEASYDVLEDEAQALDVSGGVAYSRALYAESTPGDNANLGLEIDLGLHYRRTIASNARLLLSADYSLLFPLAGLDASKTAHGMRLLIGLEM